MKGVGRPENPEAGRRLMQSLEADTLRKRQSWYADALPGFVAAGIITEAQAAAVGPFIGQPIEDVMHLETPYDKARKAGILEEAQAREMNGFIFRQAHSGTALCSGTASHVFTEDAVIDGGVYRTDRRDDSVFKAAGGAVLTLKNLRVEKEGDTTDHSEGSFTGLNAAVLAEGGEIVIEDSEIVSRAIGGNNVFAHGQGSRVRLKNVLLDAYGMASDRCIYAAFGGAVEAEGCELISRGSISSTVATDTGGGVIRLKDCLVKTLGGHCASLYSTGDIRAEHCLCVAPETEALIIVGDNRLELRDTVVLSGQGQGVKFSGGMEPDPGVFSMTGGSLTVCEGPVIAAQGGAEVTMDSVAVANPQGLAILGAAPVGMPGMPAPAGKREIHVTLKNQRLSGLITGDGSHRITLDVEAGSVLETEVPAEACPVTVRLEKDARLVLTGDTYLAALENEDPTGANLETGGYKLHLAENEGRPVS